MTKTKTNCKPVFPRLGTEKTFVANSSVFFQLKTGTGKIKPNKLMAIIKKPNRHSSLPIIKIALLPAYFVRMRI
jgi:hypothetical protein